MSVSAVAQDAGRTLGEQGAKGAAATAFPVVVTLFTGDWWDAAQIYRAWALPSASWTAKGPVAERSDVPHWLLGMTTWINSHWQGRDIFNTTWGDPHVMQHAAAAVARRFGLAGALGGLGLHWYEWDHYAFDTHYPEYFPVRDGFKEAVAALRAADVDVRVAPYINGRIYDQAAEKWSKDHARAHMCKRATAYNLNETQSHLALYDESYGSGAVFAVSCPHTSYWQDTIGGIATSLVADYGTSGVYIDQVAAAGPRGCWDPTHQHTLGGGSYWVDGYRTLLDKARAGVGSNSVLLTESNAEPFMDGINVFLTLVGFGSADFAGASRIVPVFPSIYGGYYVAMGAEFFQEDLTGPTPDVFSAKIAKQFLFGAQMGWFSLGGRSNQVPYMGIYEQLLSPTYDPEIALLQRLAARKVLANPWLQDGSHMRELPLSVSLLDDAAAAAAADVVVHVPRASPSMQQTYEHLRTSAHAAKLQYAPVMSAAWLRRDGSSLLVALVSVGRKGTHHVTASLDMRQFGFGGAATKFKVVDLVSGQSKGTFPSTAVPVAQLLQPHDVELLVISPEN